MSTSKQKHGGYYIFPRYFYIFSVIANLYISYYIFPRGKKAFDRTLTLHRYLKRLSVSFSVIQHQMVFRREKEY